jgi:hypothetical protein
MKFIDEYCGNCYFFYSREDYFDKFKLDEKQRGEITELLKRLDDTGDRCLRYPDYVDTDKKLWCGEWKRNTDIGV